MHPGGWSRLERLRWFVGRALALSLTAFALGAHAQPAATETAVKAAYLFRFLPYVEWPASALGPPGRALVVGVVSAEPVAVALAELVAGREVNGRTVTVRSMQTAESFDGVHVVFVGTGASVRALAERLGARPVLVVNEGGLEAGAMLSVLKVGERVRFEAAPLVAERVGLKLGSRLLAVAERVAP